MTLAGIRRDGPLTWQQVDAVAGGAQFSLSDNAWQGVEQARALVDAIVEKGIVAYGVSTGVGALSGTLVKPGLQRQLSRSLLMSHACGVGAALDERSVRAILATQVNNFAHGASGIRPEGVRLLIEFLNRRLVPVVPQGGSLGYLTHMAHIGLVAIGEGSATYAGKTHSGASALAQAGLQPLVLEAKDGLCLLNGTSCSTGLAAIALADACRLLDWADAIAALTLEVQGAQLGAFAETVLSRKLSPGLQEVGASLRKRLEGSRLLAAAQGKRVQDALSLRAIPHMHGAARDIFQTTSVVVDRELGSVTDNPIVSGTVDAPEVSSEAHAVSPAMGLALDSLAIAMAQLGSMSERRIDRLANPLISGLPPFLASDPGVHSGYMIAQYTALALVSENRRLAAPASLDGGTTSGLQEDFIAHPTSAAVKLGTLLDNVATILAIELLAATAAHDTVKGRRAAGTDAVYAQLRAQISPYADNRPMSDDIAQAVTMIRTSLPA